MNKELGFVPALNVSLQPKRTYDILAFDGIHTGTELLESTLTMWTNVKLDFSNYSVEFTVEFPATTEIRQIQVNRN